MPFARDQEGLEQAVRENEVIVEQTVGAEDAKTVGRRAVAFWTLGENLFRLKRFDDAVEPLVQAQEMLAGIASVRAVAAQADLTLATCLLELERVQEALDSVDRRLETACSVPELPFPDLVSDSAAT